MINSMDSPRNSARIDAERRRMLASPPPIALADGAFESELWTDKLIGMIRVLEDETHEYTSPAFWEQNHEKKATMISTITLLRLLLSRVNRAVVDRYDNPQETAVRQRNQ